MSTGGMASRQYNINCPVARASHHCHHTRNHPSTLLILYNQLRNVSGSSTFNSFRVAPINNARVPLGIPFLPWSLED